MNRLFLIAIALALISSCTTKPTLHGTFCYVNAWNLACSERTAEGTYIDTDRDFREIVEFQGYVLIPVEEFEGAFDSGLEE